MGVADAGNVSLGQRIPGARESGGEDASPNKRWIAYLNSGAGARIWEGFDDLTIGCQSSGVRMMDGIPLECATWWPRLPIEPITGEWITNEWKSWQGGQAKQI